MNFSLNIITFWLLASRLTGWKINVMDVNEGTVSEEAPATEEAPKEESAE